MRLLALRWPALLLPVLLAGACGDRNVTPFLGKWGGGLEVLRVKGPNGQEGGDPKPFTMRGDLQMYVRKFELNLSGPQQTARVRGTWSYEGSRVRLRTSKIEFGDNGGEEKRDPNLAYIEPKDLQAFLTREQGLTLSGDRRKLVGIEDALANLVARLAL